MKNFLKLFLLTAAIGYMAMAVVGCGDPNDCDSGEQEAEILDYISAKGLDAKPTGTGLYYVIEEAGSGIRPSLVSTVTVGYHGTLTDGSVFDSNVTSFKLSQVIEGWQEGIQLFKKGGSGKLLIPCTLGYGEQSRTAIPSGSVLIFDIELIDVK